MQLSDETYSAVTRLSAVGNALSDAGDSHGAVREFERALALLPLPAAEWSAAMWLYAAIGDSFFLAGAYEQARVALNQAQHFEDSLDNPFIWLRRGQVYY